MDVVARALWGVIVLALNVAVAAAIAYALDWPPGVRELLGG